MPEKKMVDVLVDIQLVQAIYIRNSQFSSDDKKDALVEGVLKKHKITQAELDSSLMWYADNIAYYETINDSVSSKLKARNSLYANNATILGQSKAQHLIPPYFNLNQSTPTLSFDIDSIKIKTFDVPKFKLRFNVQGVSNLQEIEAGVFFRYKDTIVKHILPIDKNQLYIFNKPNLGDSLLKSISGYVHLKDKKLAPLSNVMLYNISYMDSLSLVTNDSLNIETPLLPIDAQQSERQIDKAEKETVVQEAEPAQLSPSSIPERIRNKAPEIKGKDIKNEPVLEKAVENTEKAVNPDRR